MLSLAPPLKIDEKMQPMTHKNILLGITGSIAAYKSAELIRSLRALNHNVRVVLTDHAKAFITPLTLQALSGEPVRDNLFDPLHEAAMGHIELARWADILLIAPASAQIIAKLAHGLADDLLSTLCLATSAPIFVAPAMNQAMWQHPATLANVEILRKRGVRFLGPSHGEQACGDVGPGRFIDIPEILSALHATSEQKLAGFTVLITAGPTIEPIDPVRFISNRSSGKMGYALAKAAKENGAKVILVSGPVSLEPPKDVHVIRIESADEMAQAVLTHMDQTQIFIASAAVSDVKPKQYFSQKLAKDTLQDHIDVIKNRDIIREVSELSNPPFIVGFAAETKDVIAKAQAKRANKKMHMIIANMVGKNVGMQVDENAVTILSDHGQKSYDKMPKLKLAQYLMHDIANEYHRLRNASC